MPTYLTPGVYVEEVPSTSKPIEGVGTSIAAFVGLAPGGPVNTPMRISNWTQFAKLFGDPNEPDNGPFMDGAYLAHSVYGFFQNGGTCAGSCASGAGNGAAAARRRPCRRRPTSRSRPSARRRSTASTAPSRSRLPRSPRPGGRRDADLQARGRRGHGRQGGVRGPDAQEGPPRTSRPRSTGLQADPDRGGRRVAAGGPRARLPALHAVARRAPRPTRSTPSDFEGDVARGAAWAASRRSTRSRWSACRTS